ncbi:FAD:protein FMN transferase [Opitutus sp. ER46]|uniref:FAD:protein FMN transferase n=1 Tax=Opitutus sp. ER46 TaxID=2161864 RepID=UPI0011B2542B|nr:FAD:protein FMN transferase [Opitutus sp. ER46]
MSWLTFRHQAMATHFEIAVAAQPEAHARQAAAAAFREVDRLEGEFSRFVASSDIARCQGLEEGKTVMIGEDAMACLVVAADLAIATERAFDPAYAAVRASDWDAALPAFQLDPVNHTLTSRAAELRLDLGAIGKGFALDAAADVLREWDVTAACLVAGGSTVLALEPPPGERGWRVGLGEAAAVREIWIRQQALSASGTAVQGQHLIDPRTGRPARRQARAWALAPGAAQSDGLSTAFFVWSDPEVAAFCARQPEIGGALAGAEGGLRALGALAPLLRAEAG